MTTKGTHKSKVAKEKKPLSPKKVTKPLHGIGHNSEVIPGLVNIVDELLHIGEQKKALGQAERNLRNQAKTEFGVLSGPLAHEMRLRKMDKDVRVQFESSHEDLKKALGYQLELDFAGATPTKASVKSQPEEAELNKKRFTVEEEEDDEEPEEEGDDSEKDPSPAGNVITREG